jgi:hypothetical protein
MIFAMPARLIYRIESLLAMGAGVDGAVFSRIGTLFYLHERP